MKWFLFFGVLFVFFYVCVCATCVSVVLSMDLCIVQTGIAISCWFPLFRFAEIMYFCT